MDTTNVITPAIYSTDSFDSIVGRFFAIDSVTRGDGGPKGYLVRYAGHLFSDDSAAAYDQLSAQLDSSNVMPLFRKENGQQIILLVRSPARPTTGRIGLNIVLYVLTVISVFFVGYSNELGDPNAPTVQARIGLAAAFAVSLLAILTAHEFGHYLVGRYHKAPVSLPYFIPLPFPPFGTMGAVINMKAPPKNRNILLDIGIAGPLAGLIVAIPVLLVGLSLSSLTQVTAPTLMEGNSILYLLAKFVVFGKFLPQPASYGQVGPVLYWIRYFFTGQPSPIGALDVNIHPMAWAGWAGILVTSLNLIPAGQLDGGHMLYVLFGAKGSRRVLPVILVALVALGFVWNGWWLWAALVFFLVGRSYAEPFDQITPLDTPRKLLAILALVIFLIVFTPVPLSTILTK